MTHEEIVSIVERINYKPGTTININNNLGRLQVRIRIPVFDVLDSQRSHLIGQFEFDPEYFQDATHLLDFIMSKIEEAERHEAREWFSYRGERIFNPHAVQRN